MAEPSGAAQLLLSPVSCGLQPRWSRCLSWCASPRLLQTSPLLGKTELCVTCGVHGGDTPGPVHMSVEVLVLEPSYAVCFPPSPADLETHTSAFASRRARTADDRNATEVSPLPAFGRSLPRLSLYSKIHCKIFALEVVYLCFLSIFFLGSPEITRNN